jgi:hypothetical protein
VASVLVRFSGKSVKQAPFESRSSTLASETTELVVATDPRRRDDRSRQDGCVPTTHHDRFHSSTGRDTEISKTYRGVLVTASIFETKLASNEPIGPEEPSVIGGHSLGPIVKVGALDTVEDIGVLCAHRRVELRGRITRPTQDIGETMRSARSSRDRLDLMIERTQIVVLGRSGVEDVQIVHRHHARVDTVESMSSVSGHLDFIRLLHTRKAV